MEKMYKAMSYRKLFQEVVLDPKSRQWQQVPGWISKIAVDQWLMYVSQSPSFWMCL